MCVLNAQCLVIASEIFENIANNHMGWGQISILLGTRHVVYQKLSSFVEKRISMLTGLKVSSSVCKCLFYRPEHNAKWGLLVIEF